MLRGDRIREAREKLGLTQRQLAHACGLGDNLIYRYEHGVHDITAGSLIQLAEKLGVSTDYLLGLTNSPTGQLDDSDLSNDERDLVYKFRNEGWPGVTRLIAEQLAKYQSSTS